MQASRNHQVQHQPKIVFHANRNALADSPQLAHGASLHFREWRRNSAKQKCAGQPHSLDRLPDDARFERADVSGDIRKLRHAYQLARRSLVFATFLFLLEGICRPAQ